MRLIQIWHERCGDYEECTYRLVPDDWTDDEIHGRLIKAKDEYWAALTQAIKEQAPPNNWRSHSNPPYDKYPDLTVKEVKEIWEKQKTEYKEWEKKDIPTRKRFEDFLDDDFVELYDTPREDEFTVFWGHAHGIPLEYGEPYLAGGPPSPKDLVERVRNALEAKDV